MLYEALALININNLENKFSFLKKGLPSSKTACAPCMLGTPPNLVSFTLH